MKVLNHMFLGAAFAVAAMSIHAQTTQTLTIGTSRCSPGQPVDCWGVPVTNGTQRGTVWVDLTPYRDPYASRWIDTRMIGFGIAKVHRDHTYVVGNTTAKYKTSDGRTWSDIMPRSISFTYSGTTQRGQPYVGAGTVVFGDYYYVDICSARGCSGYGWHYSVVGGKLTVQIK